MKELQILICVHLHPSAVKLPSALVRPVIAASWQQNGFTRITQIGRLAYLHWLLDVRFQFLHLALSLRPLALINQPCGAESCSSFAPSRCRRTASTRGTY